MNYTRQEENLIVADSFGELNYKQKKLFLASMNASNADRQKYADALIKICNESVYSKLKADFTDGEYRIKVLSSLEKAEVECVTIKSGLYPRRLKEIPVPPLVLYTRGNKELLGGSLFGIVGSRKTLPTAYEQCKKLSAELASRVTVVTGVAEGADSAAAEGALSSGNVICVLPGGHNTSCAANVKTLRDVEKYGLTISEFTPSTSAQRFTFFLRNRIIAGMCGGVLVVSAARRSGALNTASYAADYSRDVFAFPYSPGVPSGEGCNALIKKGAYLCDGAADILTSLGFKADEPAADVALDADESAVIELLRSEGELHAEKIAAALGKKLFEISAVCASLEIKGLLVKTGGNKYAAV